jgi:hypothetical protein
VVPDSEPRAGTAGKLRPGFDRRLRWLYAGTIALLAISSASLALRAAVGEPPAFSTDPARTTALYAFAALVAAACWRALYRSTVRGSYLLVVAISAFVFAGALCGYPPKVLWIMGGASAFTLIGNLWFGDLADMDTERKYLRFRWPW